MGERKIEKKLKDLALLEAEFKALPLPKKDCAFLDACITPDTPSLDKRIICDAMGDDVSLEFCHYCRYFSKTYKVKPYVFAEAFFMWTINKMDNLRRQK
jgi:hypothetical protein